MIKKSQEYKSLYRCWVNMKRRCTKPQEPQYKDYGGRGIKVCDEWLDSFKNFHRDMGIKPSEGHSLDRIDNDGNYEPSNCRWATRSEQSMNRRRKPKLNCTLDSCESLQYSRDLCSKHYRKLLNYGDPNYIPKKRIYIRREPTVCKISDCDRISITRNLCNRHYIRWQRSRLSK